MNIYGKILEVDQYKGNNLGILTSGGDAPGMNAAIRSVVRTGLYAGCKVFFIREGFNGLVRGGDYITEATWESVSSIIHLGGTFIGTSRSKEFETLEGKLKSTKSLIKNGIENLIVVGGDGSLRGCGQLKEQWPKSLELLLKSGDITREDAEKFTNLRVVGMLGTIDNDFPGVEITIGVDTALHQIEEACHHLNSTASSHKRTFIIEVMGRHCGYLAMRTAITTEADFVFAPELPPPPNWQEKLKNKISEGNQLGKRLHLIIVAEGAIDENYKPISAEQIQKQLVEIMNLDVRVTTLGHVQRGGNASSFDRTLASMSGAVAVLTVLELDRKSEPIVIGFKSSQLIPIPLSGSVKRIDELKQAYSNHDFEKVIDLRGKRFRNTIETFKILNGLRPTEDVADSSTKRNFAIVFIGTPAGGMNSALYALVRMILYNKGRAYGVKGSIEGLILGNFVELKWFDMYGLILQGGSYLGSRKMVPPDDTYCIIANNLAKFKIDALILIGGFESLLTAINFEKRRAEHPEFCIPIAIIPATISNNIPGSLFSIGSDTALNVLVKTCDLLRLSATGTTNRVFVVETMGGRCGYLCSYGALASGADASYIFEEPFGVRDIYRDIISMIVKMKSGSILRGLILRNECCSDNYDTEFITRIFAEEGKYKFSTRHNIPGHIQQGDIPSSFDRDLAVKMAVRTTRWIFEQFAPFENKKIYLNNSETVAVVGIDAELGYSFTSVAKLLPEIDFVNRIPKQQWWRSVRPLLKMLAQYPLMYRNNRGEDNI